MRRMGWRVVLVALLVGACGGGGGGGDEGAFCDALDDLSDELADGDVDDARDALDDLAEAASDDQAGDVEDLVETADDTDEDDAEEVAELADDVADDLGGAAEDCGIDEDEFAVPPEVTTTTAEATTTTADDATTTTEDDDEPPPTTGDVDVPPGINPIGARQAVPGDIEPEFEGAAQSCFDGDMAACDALFFEQAPDGTVGNAYGGTCGGRILSFENESFECTANLFPPAEISIELLRDDLQGLLQACQQGAMGACDELVVVTDGDGSFEFLFGQQCGVRLNSNIGVRTDTCVAVFGEQAFA